MLQGISRIEPKGKQRAGEHHRYELGRVRFGPLSARRKEQGAAWGLSNERENRGILRQPRPGPLRDKAGMTLRVYRRPQAVEARYVSGMEPHRDHGHGRGRGRYPSAHG